MHRQFRELLTEAQGVSEHVIALNLDIRGFSAFSKTVESPDVATFIRHVYMRLLDEYFPNAAFFKPTGDGLLVLISYDKNNIGEVAVDVVRSCVAAVAEFPDLCRGNPMVNFEVPRHIGIGVARGTACKLATDGTTLDYSGRVLNLASRLMDLARPAGIVIDNDYGIDLLPDDLEKLFEPATVYLKGIAEEQGQGVMVHHTREETIIPALHLEPLSETRWNSVTSKQKFSYLCSPPMMRRCVLPSKPLATDDFRVIVTTPVRTESGGRAAKEIRQGFAPHIVTYSEEAAGPCVMLNEKPIVAWLESQRVRPGWEVTTTIEYRER